MIGIGNIRFPDFVFSLYALSRSIMSGL
jgi:hypothetical protein